VNLPTDNSSDQTIDFGFVTRSCTGAIGDFVWQDLNWNGIQDDSDLAGINGATVKLFRTSDLDNPIAVTTTGNGPRGFSGYYQFTGLCAGDYVVTAATPDGFSPTIPNAPGSTPATDSNGSPAPVNLPTDNSSDQTIDFGFVTPCTGSIGDFVWQDLNANGLQDSGEPGIDRVTVNLRRPDNTIIATTTTAVGPIGQHGYYQFLGLCAGDYQVEVVTPGGYLPTKPCSADQTIPNDSNCSPAVVNLPFNDSSNQTIDFGFIELVPRVEIIKYTNNADANDPNAAGVPNIAPDEAVTWTYKVTNTGNVPVPKAQVVVTDSQAGVTPSYDSELVGNGDAMFDPGEVWLYKATGTALDLTLPPPAGVTVKPDVCTAGGTQQPPRTAYTNIGTVTIPDASASDPSSYCNPPPTYCLGDFFWNDLNQNGIQDAGEAGIAGVTVQLYNCAGALIATTTTDANGLYQFCGLLPGSYQVKFIAPSGYIFSPQYQGGNPALDSNANSTGSTECISIINQSNFTIDAGLY
jgi:uncharacterized repeat protein (TIGR01451 family)